MKEFYHKWYTQYLSRDFEMLVFGHAGYPLILFPTSSGRYYENKDHGLIESIRQYIEEGKLRVYCPDGIDNESWYNYNISVADRVKTHNAYENVILNDVIGFANFETGEKKIALAGCSWGGYHSLNLAMRHPEKVDYIISMCGSFDIKPYLYGYYDDNCYFNCPIDYLPNLTDTWYLNRIKKMEIILGTGYGDFCLEENEKLSKILSAKDIPHLIDKRENIIHDWPTWKEMLPHYLWHLGF